MDELEISIHRCTRGPRDGRGERRRSRGTGPKRAAKAEALVQQEAGAAPARVKRFKDPAYLLTFFSNLFLPISMLVLPKRSGQSIMSSRGSGCCDAVMLCLRLGGVAERRRSCLRRCGALMPGQLKEYLAP